MLYHGLIVYYVYWKQIPQTWQQEDESEKLTFKC